MSARNVFQGKVGAAAKNEKKPPAPQTITAENEAVTAEPKQNEAIPATEITKPNPAFSATFVVGNSVSEQERKEILEAAKVHFDSPVYTNRLVNAIEAVINDDDFYRADFRSLPEPEKTFKRMEYIIRLGGFQTMTRLILITLALAFRNKPDKQKITLNRVLKFTTAQNAYFHILMLRYLGLLNVSTRGKNGTEIEFLF